VIVLVESHRQHREPRRPEAAAAESGVRWGKPAEFGFDQSGAEAENEVRGGFNTVDPGETRTSVKVWNLAPVWRAYDVVEIQSSEDPDVTIEATVTREMLIPVGSRTEKYVGGGIGYVEDPGDYGFEERVIHSFVQLGLPSPVPGAQAIASGEEGAWPDYPLEAHPPGRFLALAPVPGPWTR
jgi:hypothetical protein